MSERPLRLMRWSEMSDADRARLVARGVAAIFDEELRAGVGEIVDDVRRDGDAAVIRALARFDGVELEPDRLRVGEDEIARARGGLDESVRDAIRLAIANIRAFNEHFTRERGWRTELAVGHVVGEKITPIASAGLFVPSGKGSFPSVLVQIGTPAVVAGVPELAVVTPPLPGGGGAVDPAVLCVAAELGIQNVFRA